MALMTCKECGAKVSSKAKACPTCGAKPPKKTSLLSVIVACAALALMVKCTLETTEAENRRKEVEAAKTPAQKEAEARGEKEDQERRAAVRVAVSALRAQMRDPESLAIEQAYATGAPVHVCLIYRARNGFGGLNVEQAVFTGLKFSQAPNDWNSKCAKSATFDLTNEARSALP